jgi:hypothetical protein
LLPRAESREALPPLFHLIRLGGDDGTRTTTPCFANTPHADGGERLRTI